MRTGKTTSPSNCSIDPATAWASEVVAGPDRRLGSDSVCREVGERRFRERKATKWPLETAFRFTRGKDSLRSNLRAIATGGRSSTASRRQRASAGPSLTDPGSTSPRPRS